MTLFALISSLFEPVWSYIMNILLRQAFIFILQEEAKVGSTCRVCCCGPSHFNVNPLAGLAMPNMFAMMGNYMGLPMTPIHLSAGSPLAPNSAAAAIVQKINQVIY
jgi:hypothetical protein